MAPGLGLTELDYISYGPAMELFPVQMGFCGYKSSP